MNIKIAQIKGLRNDLFEDELDHLEELRQQPGGGHKKFETSPHLMSFDDRDEMDKDTASELRRMQEDYFGQPGGMATGRDIKPWERDPFDPFSDSEALDDLPENIDERIDLSQVDDFTEAPLTSLPEGNVDPHIDQPAIHKTPAKPKKNFDYSFPVIDPDDRLTNR
jgi:hypothetical protein